MIILGAHTELCLTAATSLLLPLVPSDYTERRPAGDDADSLHHLHRSTGAAGSVRDEVQTSPDPVMQTADVTV